MDEAQWEQLVTRARHMRKRSGDRGSSLDDWIQRVVRKDQRALLASTDHASGVVSASGSSLCAVDVDGTTVECQILSHSVVVGDDVVIGLSATGVWTVIDVKPRRTTLSRPDVGETARDQVIVANVDVIVIVVSVVTPPLHPRLIDRYLVAIQQGRAEPLICVNKIDLLHDRQELDVLEPYRSVGIETLTVSAHSGASELRVALRGRICAFVGHSGVGKSSLVNALSPGASLATGSVSEGYGRGTHTTTSSSLHRLADGTVLIDTPGIRSFGLRAMGRADVAQYFPEFEGHVCRFRDCAHLGEPGCGVREAVDTGGIPPARYDSYRRLVEEA